MIKPTVGRVVLFVPKASSNGFGYCVNAGNDHSARIAYVHGDRCMNLEVIDANGKSFDRTSVQFVQEGDEVPGWDYCKWMTYQIQQAKSAA